MRRQTVIAVANEKVPIATVCRMLGVAVDDGVGRNRKVHCPFGDLYHSDQGLSPAMRVYPESNSAFCFSCSAYYTPVHLAARAMNVDQRTAAARLLDRIGYRPLDPAAAWQRVQRYEPPVDKALLAEALKIYCRRIEPTWALRQFEPRVAATLTRCLRLLDLVRTDEDVQVWLAGCKEAMIREMQP